MMYFEKLGYKIRNLLLGIRYWFILKLVRKMPVIINCTIYDDVMEYNFGKTRTYKPCICFNNHVKRLDSVLRKVVDGEISLRLSTKELLKGDGVKVSRNINNTFVLHI